MGFFSSQLPGSLRSSAYSINTQHEAEHFDLPSSVEVEPLAQFVDHQAEANYPSQWRGNTGDLYQDGHSFNTGQYQLDYLNVPGRMPDWNGLNPAQGSADLVLPRDSGGIPGTNRIIHSDGPVRGSGANEFWTGENASTVPNSVGYNGPVLGGMDHGQGVAQSYYAEQNAYFSRAAMESSLIAAI